MQIEGVSQMSAWRPAGSSCWWMTSCLPPVQVQRTKCLHLWVRGPWGLGEPHCRRQKDSLERALPEALLGACLAGLAHSSHGRSFAQGQGSQRTNRTCLGATASFKVLGLAHKDPIPSSPRDRDTGFTISHTWQFLLKKKMVVVVGG